MNSRGNERAFGKPKARWLLSQIQRLHLVKGEIRHITITRTTPHHDLRFYREGDAFDETNRVFEPLLPAEEAAKPTSETGSVVSFARVGGALSDKY